MRTKIDIIIMYPFHLSICLQSLICVLCLGAWCISHGIERRARLNIHAPVVLTVKHVKDITFSRTCALAIFWSNY